MKKVFHFVRSMRFGMILLVLVMMLSLVGSLIPQQESAMTYVRAYGAQTAQLLIALGATDIFHTWVFEGLEILLCLNLLLCSILRFPKTVKAHSAWMAQAGEAETEQPIGATQRERLIFFLRRRRFHLKEQGDAQVWCRNQVGFFGSFLTHLSILLVLLFGSLVLITPEIMDRTVMPGEEITLADGTVIACASFHIVDDTGKLDYASVLTMRSADGRQEKQQEIRVNEPMRFGAYKVYQQTYGTAGRVKITNHANGAEDLFTLTDPCFLSIDGQNGVYFNALYPGYVRDDAGNYTLITSTATRYENPVYAIQSIAGGMSTSVLAFPEEELQIGEISFTFLSPMEYPGLRIKKVSSWLYGGLYFSFGLMVLALTLCFFTVPVYVAVKEDGYAILSPKPQQGLQMDIHALLEDAKPEEDV